MSDEDSIPAGTIFELWITVEGKEPERVYRTRSALRMNSRVDTETRSSSKASFQIKYADPDPTFIELRMF